MPIKQSTALCILDIGVGVSRLFRRAGVTRPFEEMDMDSQHGLVLHNKYKLTVFIS